MRQPELDRVPVGFGRELVHERLHREHVEMRSQRPQRRCPQRHRRQQMIDDLIRRKVVSGNRIATRSATALLRRFTPRADLLAARAVAGRQERGVRCHAGAADEAATPDLVAPGQHVAVGAQSAEIRTTPAGPRGDQLNSSGRDHTTCTGRPGTARASTAASIAASSAPLWP